jgi:hypothetical protein
VQVFRQGFGRLCPISSSFWPFPAAKKRADGVSKTKKGDHFVNKSELSSEVALLRQRIHLEYEAAQWGLSGIAQGTAQHAFITKRLENMANHHSELKHLVGENEAISILIEVFEQPY